MKRISTIAVLAVVAMSSSSCRTTTENSTNTQPRSSDSTNQNTESKAVSSDAWQSDFTAFAEAVKLVVKRGENLEEQFTNKPIRWNITFKTFSSEYGYLYFNEATPLQSENPAISIKAEMRKEEFGKAAKLKAGQRIVIRGKLGYVIKQTTGSKLSMVIIGPKQCAIE